jgi:TusA-related sulfurtransferase
MPSDDLPIDDVLIAYGDACATLTPRIKTRLRALDPGSILEVRTDDPAAHEALGAWSRLTGHPIVAVDQLDERRAAYLIRKR